VAFDTVQPWKEQVATGLIFIQTRSLGHDQDTRATAAQGTWPAGLRTLCVQVGSFLTHYCNNLLAHEFIIQEHVVHEDRHWAASTPRCGVFVATAPAVDRMPEVHAKWHGHNWHRCSLLRLPPKTENQSYAHRHLAWNWELEGHAPSWPFSRSGF
jgi:hypothetical protein